MGGSSSGSGITGRRPQSLSTRDSGAVTVARKKELDGPAPLCCPSTTAGGQRRGPWRARWTEYLQMPWSAPRRLHWDRGPAKPARLAIQLREVTLKPSHRQKTTALPGTGSEAGGTSGGMALVSSCQPSASSRPADPPHSRDSAGRERLRMPSSASLCPRSRGAGTVTASAECFCGFALHSDVWGDSLCVRWAKCPCL